MMTLHVLLASDRTHRSDLTSGSGPATLTDTGRGGLDDAGDHGMGTGGGRFGDHGLGGGGAAPRCLIDFDAIVYYLPALRFVIEVRSDPKLREQYGAKADAWLKDVEASLRAWDKRECWHDLGERGGWYTFPYVLPDRATGQLVPRPDRAHAGGTIPYNKAHAFLQSMILAYRLTGDPWYKTRLEQCAKFFRAHWRVDANHAEWNYRDHEFKGDFESEKFGEGKAKTKVFVHPRASYYKIDVETVVAYYDAGIFFKRADLELLLKTNLEFMFKGDPADPKFKVIDGSNQFEKYGWGEGFLWTSLGHFSEKVRELWQAELAIKKAKLRYHYPPAALGYLAEMALPVSWEPRHVKDIPAGKKSGAK